MLCSGLLLKTSMQMSRTRKASGDYAKGRQAVSLLSILTGKLVQSSPYSYSGRPSDLNILLKVLPVLGLKQWGV